MKNTGFADLPLHGGTVPKWLAERMMQMGTLIVESLVYNFGRKEVLVRLSDPLWFQSFGAVMGMDWHSSGITTSVMYALKRGLNPRAKDFLQAIASVRKNSKYMDTYVQGLRECVCRDLRIRGTFNLHGTETGRLSSSNPRHVGA